MEGNFLIDVFVIGSILITILFMGIRIGFHIGYEQRRIEEYERKMEQNEEEKS